MDGIARTSRSGGGVYLSERRLTQAGIWHHLVFTYDGNGIYAYFVDGELWPGYSELHGPLETKPGGTLAIGSHKPDEIHSIEGFIDEVRIYGRALTAEDARILFRAGAAIAGKPADPLQPATEENSHPTAPRAEIVAPPPRLRQLRKYSDLRMSLRSRSAHLLTPCMSCGSAFPITPKATAT